MGTTLTGTTPQDTYDSLIKVTDNGPLTGSLKTLTDGLGNDSALALSTGAASVTGTLAVTAGANLATASGNVGIGTSAPAGGSLVHIASANGTTYAANAQLRISGNATNNNVAQILFSDDTQSDAKISYFPSAAAAGQLLSLSARATQGDFQITGDGFVRLGSTMGGIQLNADTAAANALDDYEEGTWTPSLGGDTTYSAQVGTYTKIGRQVVIHFGVGVTTLGTGSGSSISGLPFAEGNLNRAGGGVTFVQNPSTAYASINPFVGVTETSVKFVTSTILGVYDNNSTVFTNGSFISGTITYFV